MQGALEVCCLVQFHRPWAAVVEASAKDQVGESTVGSD